jgi:PilZ domain
MEPQRVATGEEEQPVRVVLTSMDGQWRIGAVLDDMRGDGCRLRASGDQAVTETIGTSVTLWLVEEESGIELPIESKLSRHTRDDRGHVLDLAFTDLRTVGGLLQPLLARRFNRRSAFRVKPGRYEGPYAVTLVAPADVEVPLTTGALVDVSTRGLAVDMPASFEAAMTGKERVEVLFRLPTSQGSLVANGRIAHRTVRGELVRYGVQFLNVETPEFQRTHDIILSYVIRRQREQAEEHELMHGGTIPLGALGKPRLKPTV